MAGIFISGGSVIEKAAVSYPVSFRQGPMLAAGPPVAGGPVCLGRLGASCRHGSCGRQCGGTGAWPLAAATAGHQWRRPFSGMSALGHIGGNLPAAATGMATGPGDLL